MDPANFSAANRWRCFSPCTVISMEQLSLYRSLSNVAFTCSSVTSARSPSSAMYTFTTVSSSRKEKLSILFGAGPAASVGSAASDAKSFGSGLGAAPSPCATLSCQSARNEMIREWGQGAIRYADARWAETEACCAHSDSPHSSRPCYVFRPTCGQTKRYPREPCMKHGKGRRHTALFSVSALSLFLLCSHTLRTIVPVAFPDVERSARLHADQHPHRAGRI